MTFSPRWYATFSLPFLLVVALIVVALTAVVVVYLVVVVVAVVAAVAVFALVCLAKPTDPFLTIPTMFHSL